MTAIPSDYRVALVLVGGALLAYWIVKRDLGAAARAVGTAVNPLSDRNLAYRGVNAVGGAVTGQSDFSLGSWLYDVINKPYDPNVANTPRTRYVASFSGPVQPSDKPTAFLNW